MTTSIVQVSSQAETSKTFLSEIFPISASQLNILCFRLNPDIER